MNEDFVALARAMNERGVKFILVGGYAYLFNAEARYTQDIDFWVRPDRENIERLSLAIDDFMGGSLDIDEVMALLGTTRLGFSLAGIPPARIEILLRVSGLDFDLSLKRARVEEQDGVSLFVLHPHDQIRNKRASGREKDLLDVKTLVRLHGEPPEED